MEKLLQSKTKTKLLSFFFTRPERGYFIGEIKKKAGGRKLLSDISSLIKQEVLRSHGKKGSRYYRINQRHPDYLALKNWAKKIKRAAEDDLVKAARKVPGAKMVVVSGFLTGNNKLECDLLLIGKISPKKINNFIRSAEKLVHNEINYAVMGWQEFQYRKNTFDRFMKDIFENDHVVLIDKTK